MEKLCGTEGEAGFQDHILLTDSLYVSFAKEIATT